MVNLPVVVILHLATTNAPLVAPETVLAFAQAESAMNPYAVHDNTTRRSHAPTTAGEAAVLARRLLDQGHSIDAGLMQINSTNFARTGLTAETAFDPAHSIRAGGEILVDAYRWCRSRQPSADPLRCMASVYNTGGATAGEKNGYVGRVWAAADRIVPAIREAVPPQPSAPQQEPAALPANACGPPPPAWDGWAVTAYRTCINKISTTSSGDKAK